MSRRIDLAQRQSPPEAPDTLRRLRAEAEAAIEQLLTILDDIDGDVDLEDGGDLEPACEDEGAQCDDEGVIETDAWRVVPDSINQLSDGHRSYWLSGGPAGGVLSRRVGK